jgi:AraC-like DNA-binding protein
MDLIVLFTSILISLSGGLIVYRFFKDGNRLTRSISGLTLFLIVLDLSVLRIGVLFDIFDWGFFKYSFKSSLFSLIAGFLNPILVITHFFFLVKPGRLVKGILFCFFVALIILFIAGYFNYSIFELKKIELILAFTFVFLFFINLEIFFISKVWDVQFKIWVITISCIEIIAILMAFWQIEVDVIKGDYSTLISNEMNLIIMNILILLSFSLVLQFPRILSGDIGFVENYEKIDQMEQTIHKSTSYASLNPKLWRFVHGSFSFQQFSNDKILINELEKHSSEIYHKISIYEFSVIQNLGEFSLVNDLYTLSQKLKVNSTILELFFKVYCNYSWSKYTKLLRVLKAEYLISNGFLLKNDMNALALEVGFNNRVTLYNNFKDVLGHAPSVSKEEAVNSLM